MAPQQNYTKITHGHSHVMIRNHDRLLDFNSTLSCPIQTQTHTSITALCLAACFFYYYYFYLILLFFTLLHFNCTLAFASIRAACGYFYVCTAKITFQIQPNSHLSR